MNDLLRRYGAGLSSFVVVLTVFWLLFLVILPYFDLFESSFRPYLPAADVGGPLDVYSLNNYLSIFQHPMDIHLNLFGQGVNFSLAIHLWVFFLTIFYSAGTTLLSLLACYPLAYYLAKVISPNRLASFMLLLVVPMWVSELLRAFAWFILLAFKGPLTVVLMDMGIISEPIHWTWGLGGYSGVVVTLIYVYILFMLFPLYNSMTSLDSNQMEAAEDLGAKWWQTHWRVIVPHCKPGIASGCVTVFMLAVGSLLVPTLLQSPSSRWFTEVIYSRMFDENDWNGGAAYAFILLFMCTVFVSVMMRLFKVGLADIAK
jgi:spermidine/putrescine transport system permease protein